MSEKKKVIVIGGGGHSRVIIDILLSQPGLDVIGILDDDEKKIGTKILGIQITGRIDAIKDMDKDSLVIIGVGDNSARSKLAGKISSYGFSFFTAIHPSVIIGKDVVIGAGTVIMANSVINPGTRIGMHSIINTSSSIDHDNEIGDFVHISPGSTTGGTVRIGEGTWIGLGSKIINNIEIGKNSIIGAGSVVIENIGDNVLAVGCPAKVKKELSK